MLQIQLLPHEHNADLYTVPYQVIYVYLWLTYDGCFSEETESMRVLVSHCHCLYATQVWVMHFQKFTKNSSKSVAGLSTRKFQKLQCFCFSRKFFQNNFCFDRLNLDQVWKQYLKNWATKTDISSPLSVIYDNETLL